MNNSRTFWKRATLILIGLFIVSFSFAHAQTYTPLENIPGTSDAIDTFPAYIQAIYKFAIWGVGIAALFMIIIGGFWYMTAAGNTSQMGTAKKIITDAFFYS